MKNPKSEIRMTKQTQSANDEQRRQSRTAGVSALGFRRSLVMGNWPPVIAHLILLSILCRQAWVQYSIGWHTIDGGGGTSTGSVYSVSGASGVTNPIVLPATLPAKFDRVFRP